MFAVCAIAKEEPEHYVREWLDWHRSIGVDRFFIYDNGGWVVRGNDIVVVPCCQEYAQVPAYNHCLRNCDNADFLAFIDLDEFISGQVIERLESVENALALHWKGFGTSGLEWNPCGRQMGVFRLHMRAESAFSRFVKCIVRPSRTTKMYIHCGEYVDNGMQETFGGKRFQWNSVDLDRFEEVCVNHYFTRSMHEWEKKVKKGRACVMQGRRLEGVFVMDGCCTESEDGGAVPLKELLPYVSKASYGSSGGGVADVTEKVKKLVGTGFFVIEPWKYNEFFGDTAEGEIKRLKIRFERRGAVVGEIDVGENERLELP